MDEENNSNIEHVKISDNIIWGVDTNVLIRYCCISEQYNMEYNDKKQYCMISWMDVLIEKSLLYPISQAYRELFETHHDPSKHGDRNRLDILQNYSDKKSFKFNPAYKKSFKFNPAYKIIRNHDQQEKCKLRADADKEIQKIYDDVENNPDLTSKKERWFKNKSYTEMPELEDDKKILQHMYVTHKINPDWKVKLLSYDADITIWKEQIDNALGFTVVDGFKFNFDE